MKMLDATLRVPGIDRPLVELPPAKSSRPSVFACSLGKAGSNLFFAILKELCLAGDLIYVDIPGAFWEHGIDPARVPLSASKLFQPYGYCYVGFRAFPREYDVPNFAGMRKLLLVRDIRDMLVSNYFSTTRTHGLPGTTLDTRWRDNFAAHRDFLKRLDVDKGALYLSREYRRPWRTYRKLLKRHEFRIWRYEDVVFEKRAWIAQIMDYVGMSATQATIDHLLERIDIVPEVERPGEFIRKVKPGDFLEKLSSRTIRRLDRIFGDYLDAFLYEHRRSWLGRRAKPLTMRPSLAGFDNREWLTRSR